jgi:hypothetical protein
MGAQQTAAYEMRKSIHYRLHQWVASLFADAQKVKIGSLRYGPNGELKEPETPFPR